MSPFYRREYWGLEQIRHFLKVIQVDYTWTRTLTKGHILNVTRQCYFLIFRSRIVHWNDIRISIKGGKEKKGEINEWLCFCVCVCLCFVCLFFKSGIWQSFFLQGKRKLKALVCCPEKDAGFFPVEFFEYVVFFPVSYLLLSMLQSGQTKRKKKKKRHLGFESRKYLLEFPRCGQLWGTLPASAVLTSI